MEPALLLDPVTLSDTVGAAVNPASEDTLAVLKQIRKILESNTIVDSKQRQRVVVEAIGNNGTPTSFEVNQSIPVSLISSAQYSANSVYNGPPTVIGSVGTVPVFEGPVDQRWRIIEAARTTFATGVRPNLSFT